MFPAGSRVIAVKTIVAGGEGLSLPKPADLDPASRYFIHAELGDEGFVVEDHAVTENSPEPEWRERFHARWLIRFPRTNSLVHCDPTDVTAWVDYRDCGEVTLSALSFGITTIAVRRNDAGRWDVVSSLPHDDHSASHDDEHEETYGSIEEAQAAAEPRAIAQYHAAAEAHRKHQIALARYSTISELDMQIEVEKRRHEIIRLRLEQAEMETKHLRLQVEKAELQARLDSLGKKN